MTPKTKFHVAFNAMSIRPGGGLTVLLGVLDGLRSQHHLDIELTVICSLDATLEALEKQGIATCHQLLKNASGWKRQLWTIRSMGKYVDQCGADVLFSFNQYIPKVKIPQAIYHINLTRFLPIDPSLSPPKKLIEWLRNRSSRQALKYAAANIFESSYIQEVAETIVPATKDNYQYIYIGLPDHIANSSPADDTSRHTVGQICAITNGHPHKDNETLIRHLDELIKLRPDVNWTLKIAGGLNSAMWEPYLELAQDLGIRDRIKLIGFIDQDQLTDLLHQSLCLVSTSLVESFCMVALEAMGRGCPAVVADCTSMPESVGNAAILVQPGDPVGFAEAVLQLHDEPKDREKLITLGYEHVKSFRWNRCGQQFADVFSNLVELERRET